MIREGVGTALHEHFTEAEANALADYLRTSCDYLRTSSGDHQFIEKAELPIENNTMPISAISLGGPQYCIRLRKREDYPLPVLVQGYYDLRSVYDENGKFLGERAVERARDGSVQRVWIDIRGCPHCGAKDGSAWIGDSVWHYCAKHRVKWLAGWDLTSPAVARPTSPG
jgi:hypothetical protein